jgi:hypothetical protein
MGLSVFPAAAGGGIKLVQRGQAVSSGNITITAVNTAKTFVRSFSEGAAGTVATNSVRGSHNLTAEFGSAGNFVDRQEAPTRNINISAPSVTLSGGTMDATTKQMGVYLSDSTTLVATGACRWEVVEFA